MVKDKQTKLPGAWLRFRGAMDYYARFIEENQLLLEEDWHLFVNQFRSGVDDADAGWRGEYFGKMMRGACMTYRYTQNEALYELLTKIAEEMLTTQDDQGRFSSYSPEKEFIGWDMWSRKYVLLGYLHYLDICRDEALKARILAALERHLDYVVAHIGPDKKPLEQTSHKWKCINSASILEPTLLMYNRTGKESYLAFAQYIIDFLMTGEANIFALALENKLDPYQYPVTKAYEMMSCFEGLLEYYRLTGEEKWLRAAVQFADRVHNSDITVIGCAGCRSEQFDNSARTQTNEEYQGIMQETCVTVTWMKLCDQLLRLTGDPKYGDWIEVSLYNALFGAVNTDKCQTNNGFPFDSYSPLYLQQRGRKSGGFKLISDTRYYGCCVAIGAAGLALPLLTAAMETDDGLAVNYYEEGTLVGKGLTLEIRTGYPAGNLVQLRILEAEAQACCLALRIPAYGKNSTLTLNGQPVTVTPGYTTLCRTWQAGDELVLSLDMAPRVVKPLGMEGKPETLDFLAVQYGPLTLARDGRLSEVGTPVAKSDWAAVKVLDKGEFPCILRADVTLGDQTYPMVNYSAAGKTWDKDSLTECWLKCK